MTIPGQRGRVIDRTGKVLAVSEDAADVIATPYQVKDPVRTAERLHDVTGVSEADLSEALSDRSSGFAYLARKVDLDTADRVERLQIAGVSTVPDSRRLYPQGELASQVIGAVGTENQGLTGLEQAEDDVLGGANGEEEVVHDALGEPLRTETVRPASIGQDVRVTLDAAIQGRTEEALAEAGEQFEAKGATAIVMDPSGGDILAMANWPGYDPTDLESASEEELANRATGFTYEPGSTFKAFTVAAALEDKVVTPQTSFYLPSEIQVADRRIGEAHERSPIDATVSEILAQSSNVGAVKIGLEEGPDRFSDWIDRFGFGEKTGLDYPGEEQGIVPSRDDYSGSTMGNLPIGQGLAVTPLQMAAGYSAIANGGILRRPRLITQVGSEPAESESERGARDQHRDLGPAPPDARGRAGARRYRLLGQRPGLRARRQDRHRTEGRGRHIFRLSLRRLVRRFRSRPEPEAAGYGGRRRAALRPHRGRGGGTRLRRHRLVCAPLPGDLAAINHSSRGPHLESPAMRLEDLLRDSGVAAEVRGDTDVEISDLAYDSRHVGPGTLFFCVTGLSRDGHEFAGEAVEAGAAALVVERPLELGVPEVQVADARAAMAPLAAAFWGDPTEDLTVIGVTGTNGKTTTAFLVRHLLEDAGRRCGLLGTVQRVVGGQVEEVERTTPEAIDLQATFRRMAEAGDEACVLEVSSHALVLHRADAIRFDVKVFTNLTQDHLDFHEGMEDYFAAKRLLFTAEGGAPTIELEGGVSVVNVDDPYGRRLAEELAEGPSGDRVTFSPGGARRT